MDSQFTLKDLKELVFDLLFHVRIMEQRFLDEPDEIEHVHELRVTIRQTRSLISLIKPFMDLSTYTRLQSTLRSLSGRFGFIREIDVLKLEWEKWKEKNPILSEREVLSSVLANERRIERNALITFVSSGRFNHELGSALATIWLIDNENPDFEEVIRHRFIQWNKKLSHALDVLDSNDYQSIHRTRIRFKKIRYVFSLVEPLKDIHALDLKVLKKIQDVLGAITDTFVNVPFLEYLNQKVESDGLGDEIEIYIGYQLALRKQSIDDAKKLLDQRKGANKHD